MTVINDKLFDITKWRLREPQPLTLAVNKDSRPDFPGGGEEPLLHTGDRKCGNLNLEWNPRIPNQVAPGLTVLDMARDSMELRYGNDNLIGLCQNCLIEPA